MKVLHIASWFPNSKDPFDGDFVQRQVQALSLFMRVDVIHVVQKFHLLQNEKGHEEEAHDGNFHCIVYFPAFPKISQPFLQKLLFARRYNKTIKHAINRYIQQNGRPDIIHIHVPVKAGYIALYLKRKYGIPFVVTEHSSSYFVDTSNNYFENSYYFKLITRKSFQKAVLVSSVSNWLLRRLAELFNIKTAKVIRNVVDSKVFFPVQRSVSKKRFIHVSMMIPLKNVEGIIEALYLLERQTNNWEMVFVGDATEEIKNKASELANKIHFTGMLSYKDVAVQMQNADALIHFSNYENLPCVINEALCCGLPVISSKVGGIDELVNETNGILVNSKDVNGLSEAMLSFLDNPQRFNKEEISKEATSQFAYEVIGNEMFTMYKELLNNI